MEWLFERLNEKSTWLGLVNFLISAGVFRLSTNVTESLVAAAAAISGAVLVIMKEKKR